MPKLLHRTLLASLLLFPVAMLVGHLGAHELDWQRAPLSRFAALAPYDFGITAGMLLAALGLTCASLLSEELCGPRWLGRLVGLLFAFATGGLLLLAIYEETVHSRADFQTPRLAYYQGFHNAGLQLFYHPSILALLSLGGIGLKVQRGARRKALCLLVMLAALGAPIIFASLPGEIHGLRQRLAFASLWVSMMGVWALLRAPLEAAGATSAAKAT
jgi:hypothetical protein